MTRPLLIGIVTLLLGGCAVPEDRWLPEAQERDLRAYAFVVCVNSVYKELHSQSRPITTLLDEEEQILIRKGGFNAEMSLRIAARSREFAATTPVSTAMRACMFWRDSDELSREIQAFRQYPISVPY